MGKKNVVFRPPSLEMRTMGCRNPYENGWIGWIGMIDHPQKPSGASRAFEQLDVALAHPRVFRKVCMASGD
jgi:hypothetical protein